MIKMSKTNSDYHPTCEDDSCSLTSSTLTQRITRKRNQTLLEKRSISRNSSKNSDDSMDLTKFYVKTLEIKERKSDPVRPAYHKGQNQSKKMIRRSPTPTVGFIKRQKQQIVQPKNQETTNLQVEIQMAILQKALSEERSAKETVQRKLYHVQNQLKASMTKIQQLQAQRQELNLKEQRNKMKLQEYQRVATTNEQNLNEVRQNLQKLKAIIKKNRMKEIQAENGKLKKQNYELMHQLKRQKSQNEHKNQIIFNLEHQMRILTKQNEDLLSNCQINDKIKEIERLNRIIQIQKSQKQRELELLVMRKSQQEAELRTKIQKLQINLNCFNVKKNEEINGLKQKHNILINKMRDKMINANNQYHNLKVQYQKLKKNTLFTSTQVQRKNYMINKQRENQEFLFHLSP